MTQKNLIKHEFQVSYQGKPIYLILRFQKYYAMSLYKKVTKYKLNQLNIIGNLAVY